VYTTRPDTIFGVDFMVVAPELELVQQIKSSAQSVAVDEYIAYVKSRSDIDRMAEKKITGCFTGAYAINPFDGKEIPIYISEYVLAGYGTGAIMAVPCGDERDFKFAKHFNIPITNIIGHHFNGEEANATKEAILENSGFLNGTKMMDATAMVLQKLEAQGIGKRKVNYRMRDAGFSRQRYWGEPFPIIWSDGIAIPLDAAELPLELPHVDKYGPGPEGEGPLGNITDWVNVPVGKRETSTMPGYAGSSWYFLRYMDPENATTFCDRKASDYWNQVDLYIGGTEHAVGHLLYSRLWTKILFDLGHIGFEEPFKKLLNQGMIQGSSRLYYWVAFDMTNKLWAEDSIFPKINLSKGWNTITTELKEKVHDILVSHGLDENLPFQINRSHVNVNIVDGVELDINELTKDKYKSSPTKDYFVMEDGSIFSLEEKYSGSSSFICEAETEKMSKSKYNTVNPDELCNKFGADTFRMYEMFLGPVEQSKPWDTKGIEGVHRFLRKLWRLFFDDIKGKVWTSSAPSLLERAGGEVTDAELKVLHKAIKKIEEDTERFSFNTAVSTFMICVNELADLKCHKKEILEKVLILLTPYAPHIAEELWHQLGNEGSILDAAYPTFNPALLVESSKEYPVSINGKVRTNINLSLDLQQADVEKVIAENEIVQKWLEGKSPKKVIYVKNKMINVVV
jgi:leucyl-tRNA synthetase